MMKQDGSESKQRQSSKNRKRPRVSKEKQLEQERVERYNKLVHMAKKALHKEAKVVKSFECQKVVRKLKQDGSNIKLERKLEEVKGFSLDVVVETCLVRLGVPNLDPNQDASKQTQNFERQDNQLLERMLQHKRLVSAMETWGEKVTEYRRWYLRRQENVENVPDFLKAPKKNKSKATKSSTATDLFVFLSGQNQEEGYYGPAEPKDDEYTSIVKTKKRNRPGQRSRKAKAMAIQARKEGRTWDHSLNWREKKSKKEKSKPTEKREAPASKASDIATMGQTWKEEGKEHPSWAARQSQKSGIVEFTGKKITFD